MTFPLKSDRLIPVSERNTTEKNMKNPYYYVREESGLYRMFDVSHEGLEDAIKACREVCKQLPETCVMIQRDDDTAETVWSLKVSNNEFVGRC